MCKIYSYIFLPFHYSCFYYAACLQNEILKYTTMLWLKLEGAETFYRIYNIHLKEPLAWNAGDGQQTADWASLRWVELRVADGVSNTGKPNSNEEGHRWWKHRHYLAQDDLCYCEDRWQWARPTEGWKALRILVWSSGSHPCAIPELQRQSFVPANYCSSTFYWLGLLLRLKLESTELSNWIKTFVNCNFRPSQKSSKSI